MLGFPERDDPASLAIEGNFVERAVTRITLALQLLYSIRTITRGPPRRLIVQSERDVDDRLFPYT
jgi:hypothetical protein